MGVAARVAEEMGVALGREVGYSIRFEEVAVPVRPDWASLPFIATFRTSVAFMLSGRGELSKMIGALR